MTHPNDEELIENSDSEDEDETELPVHQTFLQQTARYFWRQGRELVAAIENDPNLDNAEALTHLILNAEDNNASAIVFPLLIGMVVLTATRYLSVKLFANHQEEPSHDSKPPEP